MAEILLLHHVLGLTDGVRSLADRLRAAGHTVHTPDLFEGRTFDKIPAGMSHEEDDLGWDVMTSRARRAADGLPTDLVYLGISMGVVYSHLLVRERLGARGAVFLESSTSTDDFDGWPAGVPLQVHGHADDEFFGTDGAAHARALVAAAGEGEVFVYPGSTHLFVDDSLATFDAAQTDLVLERVLGFSALRGA
ncbi:dienelactone hydrolase family protein [Cellulomonas sp. P5_C6]